MDKTKNNTFRLALLAALSLPISAQAVDIDGLLSEPQWTNATSFKLDKTVNPFTLVKADKQTNVKTFSTKEGLYIGIEIKQNLENQTSVRTARDLDIESDLVRVIIDFDNGKSNAYSFALGNGGSKQDGIWRDENQFVKDWDGEWFGQTSQTATHWYAEYLIPWDAVPMKVVDGNKRDIALYIERHDVKENKTYSHAATAKEQPTFISQFSPLSIDNFETNSLDIFSSMTYQNDMLNKDDKSNLSLDVFWRPDASQQLSVTLNPDFGQVEADNIVVNFSPYETLFSERRSFFTQNQGLFDVRGNNNLRLIHTRRLGADSDIDAALKYTRNGDNTDIGVMAVFEDNQSADNKGSQYFTGRVLQRFEDTQLGYVFTYADKPELSRHAQVHALDIRSDLSENIQLTGQVLASNIQNELDSSNGQGAWFGLSHKLSDTWQQSLEMTYFDDELQVNDVGFLSRNDLFSVKYNNEKTWTDFSKTDSLLKRTAQATIESKHNTQNDHLGTILTLSGTENYKSTAFIYWNFRYYSQASDDRITRDNGLVKLDDGISSFAEYNFGNQGNFRHHIALGLFDKDNSGKGSEIHYHPSYYFTDDYRLSWSLWSTTAEDKLIWQNNSLNRYSYRSLNNGIDFDATIANNQELRVRFEWVAYQGKDGVMTSYDASGTLNNTTNKAEDFSRSTTRFQVRYRYEISPLSNIYLVYSRGGSSIDLDNENNWQTFNEGWDNRTADNFVAKIRYRF